MWRRLFTQKINRVVLIGWGCAALLAGIALSATGLSVSWLVAALSTLLLWFCIRRQLIVALPAVLLVGFLVGLARGGALQEQLRSYDYLIDQKITLTGTVVQDATYGSRGQRDVMVEHASASGRILPGQVRVTTFDAVDMRQGDVISATGKAKPGFGSYQLGLYFAKVELREQGDSWIAWLRDHFSAQVRSVIPEPQASLGLGFLLGIKSELPDDLNEQLKVVGLTHIVVASGYNLTILVRAARRLLANRSKYQATTVAVGLMLGFVGVTGLSPSMTRATLVTSLSLAAWYYGRVIHPMLLLVFAAAMTALWNPLYVWTDVGWYLSFLAFGGVMLLSPLVVKRLFGERKVPQLAQIIIETLCAEVVTLPLIMFVFGSVSMVALVANVIVAPLVPLAMLLTFMAGLASVVMPGPGRWIGLLPMWLLTYMTSIVGWLAAIPWAKQQIGLSLVGIVVAYLLIASLGLFLWRKTRYDYLSQSIVE